MDNYIKKFDTYNNIIVYNFEIDSGGIGDYIKYFTFLLEYCIENNIKLYYLINNIFIEKCIPLIEKKIYLSKNKLINSNVEYVNNFDKLKNLSSNIYYIVTPGILYNVYSNKYKNYSKNFFVKISKIFKVSNFIKQNKINILHNNIQNYESIHLRLGDKHLEVSKEYVLVKNDSRKYNEKNLFDYIIRNKDKKIVFFCDNKKYKKFIKKKFSNVIITDANIGHTSLTNTTQQQIIDTVTEFYILLNSEKIVTPNKGWLSGFSIMASKFNNIPFITI